MFWSSVTAMFNNNTENAANGNSHYEHPTGIYVIKTNLMHYLPSVYFVNQPLHVSGIFVAHHQEVYSVYTTIRTCCAFQLTVFWPDDKHSTEKQNTYQLLYIYSIPPDDGLQIRPKRVEVY